MAQGRIWSLNQTPAKKLSLGQAQAHLGMAHAQIHLGLDQALQDTKHLCPALGQALETPTRNLEWTPGMEPP